MRRTRLWIAVVSCFTLCGCGVLGLGQVSGASTQPAMARVGHNAPSFSLQTLDGTTTVSLKSLLGKKPIILNAWAAWCDNCIEETPDLIKLEKLYASKVQVVGIDTADHAANAKAFAKKYGMDYLLLNDSQGSFMDSYNIIGLPTTIVVAPDGKIVTIHPGVLTQTTMAALFHEASTLT